MGLKKQNALSFTEILKDITEKVDKIDFTIKCIYSSSKIDKDSKDILIQKAKSLINLIELHISRCKSKNINQELTILREILQENINLLTSVYND